VNRLQTHQNPRTRSSGEATDWAGREWSPPIQTGTDQRCVNHQEIAMLRKSHLLVTMLALAAIGSTVTAGAAAEARSQLHAQATAPAAAPGMHCGPAIPRLAAALDEMLPAARLSTADFSKVTALRDLIQELSKNGKEGSARDVEEVAMGLLGYKKLWLRCGIGTFSWIKQSQDAEAGPAQ
jgi:hypothetical protein